LRRRLEVLVGSRTDTFGKRFPGGRSGNWERSLTKLCPCPWYDVACAIMWSC